MAGRNRAVVTLRLPEDLILIVKSYQDDRYLPSFNQAFCELIESHPAIVMRIQRLYDRAQQTST